MRGPGLWLVLLLLVVVMVQMLMWPTQVENKEISYSEFLQLVQDEKISQLMVSEYNAYGLYKDSTISESSFPERYDFTLQIPNDVASFYDDVKQVLATARGVDPESITPLDYGFTLVNQPAPQPAWWVEWIPFLIMILLLFFVVTMFMESIAALTLFMPIVYPIAMSAGVDPTVLGVLVTVVIGIGLVTPPVGMCIYVACDLMKIRVGSTMKYVIPYILGTFVVIAILIAFPQLITALGTFVGSGA